MNKGRLLLACLVLFSLAFLLRFSTLHVPFWVDEFSTAEQAKLVLKYGLGVFTQTDHYFESNNILTHFITALSFTLFGVGEWQARLPMMLVGSLVPVVLFLYVRRAFDLKVAAISSALYIFSYWQIAWSRQARGYTLQQLFLVMTLWLYYELLKKFSLQKLFVFILVALGGVLTHTTFILVLGALGLHFMLFHGRQIMRRSGVWRYALPILVSILVLITLTGQLGAIVTNVTHIFRDPSNNLAYYHSFLWREQTIISLLAFIGTLIIFLKRKEPSAGVAVILPVLAYLIFVSFLFAPYVSRYLLPIFPLLFILVGVSISTIGESISPRYSFASALAILAFIIINGDTFTIKPKAFYSVNHDMREVALLDYDQVYAPVLSKGELDQGQTAVIDTWPDRQKWYLGQTQEYFYTFRWADNEGTSNGLAKETQYEVNDAGEKYIPGTGNPDIKLISELSDLEKVREKYPRGFIWIDDASMSAEVIRYAEENFKRELYIDHYTLDDNPYSIWPGTLYSWGLE